MQDNFAGLATALNTHESHTTCSIHHQPPRPQVPSKKIDINKTYLYTGKPGTANGYGHNQGYK